jgi:hypothetical protein
VPAAPRPDLAADVQLAGGALLKRHAHAAAGGR